jgi:hypothetical protein
MFDIRLCNPASAPDMSSVWPSPELRLRSQTCSVQGPNMSETCFWNLVTRSDKSGKDLAAAKNGADRTSLVIFTGTWQRTRISPKG